MLILAIAFGLSIPALAQDDDYYDLTQPVQPLQPLVPSYQDDFRINPPTLRMPTYQPVMPTYLPPPQRDWRDMVDDAMRGFNAVPPGHTPESNQMMLDRQDRAMQRNHWTRCAKYNRFCANMLRSFGGR